MYGSCVRMESPHYFHKSLMLLVAIIPNLACSQDLLYPACLTIPARAPRSFSTLATLSTVLSFAKIQFNLTVLNSVDGSTWLFQDNSQ